MRLPFQLRIGSLETKNLAGVSHWVMLTLYRKATRHLAPFFDTSFQSARLNFSHWNNTEKNCTFCLFETSVNGNVTFAYIMTFHFHSVWCWYVISLTVKKVWLAPSSRSFWVIPTIVEFFYSCQFIKSFRPFHSIWEAEDLSWEINTSFTEWHHY